jgi:DNA invertase Pin-like site-specific DNA recombinase
MKTIRVAALARVSTNKAGQDASPEHQLDDVRSYFARRDGFQITMERVDRVSGSKDERRRPGLADVLQAARAGKVDVIAATRIDRLFRSLDKWLAVSAEMQSLGVSIVYVQLPDLNPLTPTGKMLGVLLAALAEFQRDLWGEQAAAGKKRAEDAGKHCARPREEVPEHALEIVHAAVEAGEAFSWREMSERLAAAHYLQPGRVIKSTGRVREARPWNPGTLWAAYKRWRGLPGR